MPYSRDNGREQPYVFDTDSIGVTYVRDNEEFLSEHVHWEIINVDADGNALWDFGVKFETSGKARAGCFNFFLKLTRTGDVDSFMQFELRKITEYIHKYGVSVVRPDYGCCVMLTKSIETIETIKR